MIPKAIVVNQGVMNTLVSTRFSWLPLPLEDLGRNHEMMSAAVLDEGFARKVMIASHDSGGELIASQSNVCCWQLFGSPHVELLFS